MTELESILKNLNKIGTELYNKFGTDSYNIRCELHDIKEQLKAINYTPCLEYIKDENIPIVDDWIKDLGYTQIGSSYLYKNGGTYKDREQLCEDYKKEFCL